MMAEYASYLAVDDIKGHIDSKKLWLMSRVCVIIFFIFFIQLQLPYLELYVWYSSMLLVSHFRPSGSGIEVICEFENLNAN